tara:strand:- start:267 stop:1211 length:945 start_codon:yes stop_codon:yes gene_type:complete
MITKKILIFGASGQVGRYCIRRLVKRNYKVIAVTRNAHKKGYILKTQAPIGYIDIVEANIFDENKLIELISKADVCINLIGILYEKGKVNNFRNIHTNFPKKLAEICYEKKVKFVHISALGVDNVKDSKYAFSKTNGEKLIREIMPTATIIKPSLVYSVDDNLTTKFMSLLSLLPFFPLYYDGKTKFTPIHVSELAELIFFVISKELYSKTIEAIGPEVLTFKEILQILMKCIKKNRILLPLPLILARLSAFFMQVFPQPPITQDQINLLKYDNIKSENGITNFDIGCPSSLKFEETVKDYAFNWTEGGQFSKT